MKKYLLLLTILCSVVGWLGNGFCQPTPGTCNLLNTLGVRNFTPVIANLKNSPEGYSDGVYFYVGFSTGTLSRFMHGLERISAKNVAYPNVDGNVYEFDLTPVFRNFGVEFASLDKFRNQYGMYEIKMEWAAGFPLSESFSQELLCYTVPLANNVNPLPVPKNLRVSLASGTTTPTLSYTPPPGFPSGTDEWVQVRIYDKDLSRRIYAVTIGNGTCGFLACSKPDTIPSVTYPDYRCESTSQTYEGLVPGVEYLYKVDLFKILRGDDGIELNGMLQATTYTSFTVPKK